MKSKSTHTVQDIENWMYEITDQIQRAETKMEKHALTKKLKSLEAHYNSCQDKHINGKKYPVKKVPKDIPKKELLTLIDSVPDQPRIIQSMPPEDCLYQTELDLSGVFPPFTKPQT